MFVAAEMSEFPRCESRKNNDCLWSCGAERSLGVALAVINSRIHFLYEYVILKRPPLPPGRGATRTPLPPVVSNPHLTDIALLFQSKLLQLRIMPHLSEARTVSAHTRSAWALSTHTHTHTCSPQWSRHSRQVPADGAVCPHITRTRRLFFQYCYTS